MPRPRFRPLLHRLLLVAGCLGAVGSARADDPKGSPAPPADLTAMLREARQLQLQYRESAALARYEQVLALFPRSYDALWQAAVLSVNIGARYTDESRRGAYYTSARQLADRAYAVNPKGGEANYAVALTLAQQATIRSARDRLSLYKSMKPYVSRAVEYSPNLPEAWQILGRWNYRVAHLNLVERGYCRLFLGGPPTGASNTKAMEALRKARALDPCRIQYCYDLARVYLNQRHHSAAVEVLQEAAELQPMTSEELEMSRRCRKLLEQLQRS
jgi:tetratricopeptide (TPR) repeat protein